MVIQKIKSKEQAILVTRYIKESSIMIEEENHQTSNKCSCIEPPGFKSQSCRVGFTYLSLYYK